MANSIGEVFDSAANAYTPPPWGHKGDHLRAPIERGAKAVLLYALDLMAAAGVTPEEAAAQLRAGKAIEEVCSPRALTEDERRKAAEFLAMFNGPDLAEGGDNGR